MILIDNKMILIFYLGGKILRAEIRSIRTNANVCI